MNTVWFEDTVASAPSNLCGSLRKHDSHTWRGQTTGVELLCPGVRRPPAHMCASDVPPAHHGRKRP